MAGKIIITLEGDTADRGHVRLTALADQLDSLRKALTYAEEHAAVGGIRTTIYYRIVKLHSSHATLEIEAVAEDPFADRTGAVILEFSTRLRQIQAGKVPDDVSVAELAAYGAFAPSPERHISTQKISFDAPTAKSTEPLVLTNDFEQQVTNLIGPEESAWGTMTGFLETLNLHEHNAFHLYPRVGPKRVYCTFNREIRDDVKAAIDHYVEVSGLIRYRRRNNTAVSISNVHCVEVLDDGGTRLSDLRGIAPNATAGMDTRDFVDTLDEEW
jgi:hypothetical protein